jgi:dUTP pyrophosphatase
MSARATIAVAIRRLAHGAGLALPAYATPDSAGCDLTAAVDAPVVLAPGARAVIPTGIALALPAGYEGQVRPRSGLAARHGVSVLNAPGTIDADYRGEVAVILINHGESAVAIERGMRIAQLVVAPVSRVTWREVDGLPDSARGEGGFGSTGVGEVPVTAAAAGEG